MGRRRIVQNDLEDLGAEEIGEALRAHGVETIVLCGQLGKSGIVTAGDASFNSGVSRLRRLGMAFARFVGIRGPVHVWVAIEADTLITLHDHHPDQWQQ